MGIRATCERVPTGNPHGHPDQKEQGDTCRPAVGRPNNRPRPPRRQQGRRQTTSRRGKTGRAENKRPTGQGQASAAGRPKTNDRSAGDRTGPKTNDPAAPKASTARGRRQTTSRARRSKTNDQHSRGAENKRPAARRRPRWTSTTPKGLIITSICPISNRAARITDT